MTECNQETCAFAAHFSRRVEAGFTAGQVSIDGGALLLREVDLKINLLGRLASCFGDGRSPLLVKHRLAKIMAQRIFGLARGHEDLDDQEQLRSDPLLALLNGKRPSQVVQDRRHRQYQRVPHPPPTEFNLFMERNLRLRLQCPALLKPAVVAQLHLCLDPRRRTGGAMHKRQTAKLQTGPCT